MPRGLIQWVTKCAMAPTENIFSDLALSKITKDAEINYYQI